MTRLLIRLILWVALLVEIVGTQAARAARAVIRWGGRRLHAPPMPPVDPDL